MTKMTKTLVIQSPEPKYNPGTTVWLIKNDAVGVTTISALQVRATYYSKTYAWNEQKNEHWYWLPLYQDWFPEWRLFPDKTTLLQSQ